MTRPIAALLVALALVSLGIAAVLAMRPANGPCDAAAVVTEVRSSSGAVGIDREGHPVQDPPRYTLTVRTPDGQTWALGRGQRPPSEQFGDHLTLHCVRQGAGLFSDGTLDCNRSE